MIKFCREGIQTKDFIVLPGCRIAEFITWSHGGKMGGHCKLEKTSQLAPRVRVVAWPLGGLCVPNRKLSNLQTYKIET